jgi:hypothetical protein
MSSTSKNYDQSIKRIARWLVKNDWKFDSYSGSFVPGSSGQTPIPLKPDALAPYLESHAHTDGIISYELNQRGRGLFDINFTSLGSGQLRISVTSEIPGLEAPYNSETLIGSVSIKPDRSGSFKNPKRFTIAAQTIEDGDKTIGNWGVSGDLNTGSLSAFGLERGPEGLTNNIEALITCKVEI